jgi:putative spermidine/putrescine transport system substrate-binding protein
VRKRIHKASIGLALLVVGLALPAAGVSKSSGSAVPTQIGPGEGELKMIAWEGYLDKSWVGPFEKQTGCKIKPKYAGSSDEMVTLMRSGGGGEYDMVSASGDASLRLVAGGDVAETNVKLVKPWRDFHAAFKSPSTNTVGGKHYGISLQFGPNVLLYNTKAERPPPKSWSAIYDPVNKGQITIPDNSIQIADAALYLSKKQPSLRIKDPYELDSKQFAAVIALLKKQRPLVKKYWVLASDQIDLFKNGGSTLGASWPYMLAQLLPAGAPVAYVSPKEGVTGWLDTWMLSSKSEHPNCAYKWWNYISTPKVQAMQGVTWGETPVNKKACSYMNKLAKGSCDQYSANEPAAYYRSIKFWKTPLSDCGDARGKVCMPASKWTQAWTQVKG